MRNEVRSRLSTVFVWVACGAGAVHAAFSLYWALGGQWLLATVGQWAVERSGEASFEAGLVLGAVAAVKLVAAAVPVALIYGRLPGPGFWRVLSWLGGLFLVAYGGVNSAVSGAVLAGAIRPAEGYDREAMIGHAWLWDPLFLVWGAALCLALWFSRRRGK